MIAIKDQRSFRLLARADDDTLLQRLHRRQEWEGTSTGLMVRDLEMARRIAILDAGSEAQLQMVSSPRLIVRLRQDAPVATRIRELGENEGWWIFDELWVSFDAKMRRREEKRRGRETQKG